MKTFFCKSCNQKFEDKGAKEEWNDPTYGPCSKFTAICPNDGEICDEFRPIKTSKESGFSSPAPSCKHNGCCCCGG